MLTKQVTADLVGYLRRLNGFPILEAEEEARLARRGCERSDREAAHKLLTEPSAAALVKWCSPATATKLRRCLRSIIVNAFQIAIHTIGILDQHVGNPRLQP
jgi:hypothetical protein